MPSSRRSNSDRAIRWAPRLTQMHTYRKRGCQDRSCLKHLETSSSARCASNLLYPLVSSCTIHPLHLAFRNLTNTVSLSSTMNTGSLLTCGALIAASNHLRSGNRDQFNKALRWRVGFQGLTVLAALAGSFYYGQQSAASVPAPPASSGDAPLQQGAVTTLPGRGATVWQQTRADERATKGRSEFEGRVGEALDRELNDDKRLEEALLGKEEDLELLKSKAGKPRPVIGQDARRQV